MLELYLPYGPASVDFSPKDCIFQKLCTIFQSFGKYLNLKLLAYMKILESIVGLYVISQLVFIGGREIGQQRSKILRKVKAKFCESKISQNCNTT